MTLSLSLEVSYVKAGKLVPVDKLLVLDAYIVNEDGHYEWNEELMGDKAINWIHYIEEALTCYDDLCRNESIPQEFGHHL